MKSVRVLYVAVLIRARAFTLFEPLSAAAAVIVTGRQRVIRESLGIGGIEYIHDASYGLDVTHRAKNTDLKDNQSSSDDVAERVLDDDLRRSS